MLLFCSHWQGTQYYLGRFENERYYAENYGRMSWAGGLLGGPRSLLDARGRRIFFDWIREIRGVEQERASGWSGVMTLPRILSLATDGSLQIEPVPELECLRMTPTVRENITLNADTLDLEEVQGSCLELDVNIDLNDATQVGVQVLCSPDQSEQTGILYVPAERTLKNRGQSFHLKRSHPISTLQGRGWYSKIAGVGSICRRTACTLRVKGQ